MIASELFLAALEGIKKNQLQTLKEKILANPELIQEIRPDSSGLDTTLLQEAVKYNRLEIVKMILEQGASPKAWVDPELGSILHIAAQKPNPAIFTALLAAGAELNATNAQGQTPAFLVATCSSEYGVNFTKTCEELFFYLMEHGAVVSHPIDAFIIMCRGDGSPKIAQYLLEHRIENVQELLNYELKLNPNRGWLKDTLLKQPEILAGLAKGHKLDISLAPLANPLVEAAAHGQVAMVEMLLNLGVAELRGGQFAQEAFLAVQMGYTKIPETGPMCIRLGAELNQHSIGNFNGFTKLQNYEPKHLLFLTEPDPNFWIHPDGESTIAPLTEEDVNDYKSLLRLCHQVEPIGQLNQHLIKTLDGRNKCAQLLFESRYYSSDEFGTADERLTPMEMNIFKEAVISIVKNESPTLNKILKDHPKLKKNNFLRVLLYKAIIMIKPSVIQCLLDHGADPGAVLNEKCQATPLLLITAIALFQQISKSVMPTMSLPDFEGGLMNLPAVFPFGSWPHAAEIIQLEQGPIFKENSGTPGAMLQSCRLLLAAGAPVNATSSHGDTPLHFAVISGNLELVKVLVEAGADLNSSNIAGQTPLEMVAVYRDLKMTEAENYQKIFSFLVQQGGTGRDPSTVLNVLIEANLTTCATDWLDGLGAYPHPSPAPQSKPDIETIADLFGEFYANITEAVDPDDGHFITLLKRIYQGRESSGENNPIELEISLPDNYLTNLLLDDLNRCPVYFSGPDDLKLAPIMLYGLPSAAGCALAMLTDGTDDELLELYNNGFIESMAYKIFMTSSMGLLGPQPQPKIAGSTPGSPLARAARYGNAALVKKFLEMGGDRANEGRDGRLALVAAFEHNQLECAKIIYDKIADDQQKQCDVRNKYSPEAVTELAKQLVAHFGDLIGIKGLEPGTRQVAKWLFTQSEDTFGKDFHHVFYIMMLEQHGPAMMRVLPWKHPKPKGQELVEIIAEELGHYPASCLKILEHYFIVSSQLPSNLAPYSPNDLLPIINNAQVGLRFFDAIMYKVVADQSSAPVPLWKVLIKFWWVWIIIFLIIMGIGFGIGWWLVVPIVFWLLGTKLWKALVLGLILGVGNYWWFDPATPEEVARERALSMYQLTISEEELAIFQQKMDEAKTPEERMALNDQLAKQVLSQVDYPKSQKELDMMLQQMTGLAIEHSNEAREEDTQKVVEAGKFDRREERPLVEILPLLDEAMAKIDARLPQLFNPGLPLEEMQELVKKEPKLNHPDLITLYTWHNGFLSSESAKLFNDYNFMPVADALGFYDGEMAILNQDHLYTIMTNSFGGTLDLDLREKKPYKSLVSEEEAGLGVLGVYPGLNAFFGALLAAFQEGVFKVEAGTGPNGEDMVVASYDQINKIFTSYQFQNPTLDNQPADEDSTEDDSTENDNDLNFEVLLPPTSTAPPKK